MAQNITFIDASADDAAGAAGDVNNAVAGAGNDSIVVFEGAEGPISVANTVTLQQGQFVGGRFAVQGVTSGAVATYGSQTTVQGTVGTSDVFTIANNSTLTGLNITGGDDGVFGNNATGFTISNNTISGVGQHGINLDGVTHGADIRNNTLRDNTAGNGLNITNGGGTAEFASGSITGNTASGNLNGFAMDIAQRRRHHRQQRQRQHRQRLRHSHAQRREHRGQHGKRKRRCRLRVQPCQWRKRYGETWPAGNGTVGYAFGIVSGGSVAGNTAYENGIHGFAIDTLSGEASQATRRTTTNSTAFSSIRLAEEASQATRRTTTNGTASLLIRLAERPLQTTRRTGTKGMVFRFLRLPEESSQTTPPPATMPPAST